MVNRIELAAGREIFGNPVPLGLLGLAIGCAALVPSTLGYGLTPAGLKTASMFAYLFGAGCQMLCGLMCLANRNVLSGTVFTAFAFLWIFNGWALDAVSRGFVPDHAVGLATEIVLFVIFVALTYAFGFYSKLLFLFLLDIDLLFVLRIAKSVTATRSLDLPIGIVTILLGALALWLAFGALINPVAGRQIFRMAGPLMSARGAQGFDWSLRRALFDALYEQWQKAAFVELPLGTLKERLAKAPGLTLLEPELRYLAEFGYLQLTLQDDGQQVRSVRLNAQGIDLYEQLVLRKYG